MIILHLENDPADAELIEHRIREQWADAVLRLARERAEFLAELQREPAPDVILADYHVPGISGRESLEAARRLQPDVPFILVSGTIGEKLAVDTLRSGATDYVTKDRMERLPSAIDAAVRARDERRARERAEENLRRSEANYRAIFDQASDAIFLMAPDGRILDGNSRAAEFVGLDAAGLRARNILELIVPEQRERARDCLAQLERGKVEVHEYRMLHRNGAVLTAETSATLLTDGRVLGIARDLTARRATEEKLAEQAALLNETSEAIIVRDLEHRITFWNRGAERMLGWTSAEVVGRRYDDVLQPEPARFAEACRLTLETGSWTGELEVRTKAGKVLVVECRCSLVRDAHGRAKAFLAIESDETDRREVQTQFLRAQRLESIGTLAGGIAHDLNNLLAPITLGVEMLKQPLPPKDARDIIRVIEQSASRGAHLVRQILSFSRGFEGQRRTVAVRELIAPVAAIIEKTFPKNIRFSLNLSGGTPSVSCDPTQLEQVLLNLCVNARDAMPTGGQLSITSDALVIDEQYAAMDKRIAAGRYAVIDVVDTGTGIAPEIVDRIFDPFFTTKEPGQGTGLGLATALGIVQSHQGAINVKSERGRGTRFRIYLPAAEQAAVAEAAPSDALPRGSGECVLVVDDEADILIVTQHTLQAYGYRVLTAGNGAEAVSVFAVHRAEIDLVLTDIMMPVMDGIATVVALRQIEPDVNVVAASGINTEANVGRAKDLGVRHFLAKPYSAPTLLNTLHRALHDRKGRNSAPPFPRSA